MPKRRRMPNKRRIFSAIQTTLSKKSKAKTPRKSKKKGTSK